MGKGGSRTRSGPAPNPDALRRERDAGEWVELPAEGRPEPAPNWPLSEPSERELHFWAEMWATPQALMWEKHGQDIEVAFYVRRLVEAEEPNSPVTLNTLVRQMADSLGITTPGLHRNRWKIVSKRSPASAPLHESLTLSNARDRLKVVTDGGG